jgi:biotin transporter BioY
MNWLAIFCAGLAYFILGFVWYSLLFGKIWAAEQLRHCGGEGGAGPAKREFAGMLIANIVCNLVASAAIACLLRRMGIVDLATALKLGAGLAAGFSITTLTIVHVWEKKSTKVWMIDASYHLLGCMIAAAILVSWG